MCELPSRINCSVVGRLPEKQGDSIRLKRSKNGSKM